MSYMQKRQYKKLSARIPGAALQKTTRALAALRALSSAGSGIADELSHLLEDMRQVPAEPQQPFLFTKRLNDNRQLLTDVFRGCSDVKFREFRTGNRDALLLYVEGLSDTVVLEQRILGPLLKFEKNLNDLRQLSRNLLPVANIKFTRQPQEVITDLLAGGAILLLDGFAECLVAFAPDYVKRPVGTNIIEGNLRGAKDAFVETLLDNIVLIRRRTRDPNVKIEMQEVGTRTKTTVAIVYCSTLVKPGLAEEVKRRIAAIQVDQLLVSGTIEDYIVDHPWNPFPQVQNTESPSTVAAALYEGRAAILVDNTPTALIVPCTMTTMLQITEDFSITPVAATLLRITRFGSAFLAIYLPSIYVGIASFHPGMLPTPMAITIAQLRANTPFPAIIEALVMEMLLEIFQEAIIRLPEKFAGAASIVGALVIGTTTVQAGIVNPLLVIIMAGAALASYTMTSYPLSIALRVYRVPLLMLTAMLGLYGLIIGAMVITVNLAAMRSFGESYIGGLFGTNFISDWKDQFLRVPAKLQRNRSKELGAKDPVKAGGES